MPLISKTQIDSDMMDWYADLQKKRTPVSGAPASAKIESETFHITGDKTRQFLRNPQQFLKNIETSSRNSSNDIADPLFGG